MTSILFQPTQLGSLALQNHIVMSPMTRCRAGKQFAPTELAAAYYEQRATAGLIITEGTSPSPNGQGYARIPGLWNEAQVAGWSEVAKRVHAKGAKMFAQLMHTGRVSHSLNMPEGDITASFPNISEYRSPMVSGTNPPSQESPMPVCRASGRVRYSESMNGFSSSISMLAVSSARHACPPYAVAGSNRFRPSRGYRTPFRRLSSRYPGGRWTMLS